eukprot:TRINITY_DN367_c0_g1_i3.p1 TRINITY_DN367_c0_g1~~TRINITY_DN367_c0_g1_i3.p1  ORF type:complete len:727 (+),score=208.86 TRINITY_DN367_c0_g1_i3:721-2901(+)
MVGDSMFVYGGINRTRFQQRVRWFDIYNPSSTTGVPRLTTRSFTGTTSSYYDTTPITMNMTVDADFASFNPQALVIRMAEVLVVPIGSIHIVNYQRGSVVVLFTIYPAPGFVPQETADRLVSLVAKDPNVLGDLGKVLAINQVTARPARPPAQPTNDDSSDRANALALGLGLGLGGGCVVLLMITILAVLLSRKRRPRRDQNATLPEIDDEVALPDVAVPDPLATSLTASGTTASSSIRSSGNRSPAFQAQYIIVYPEIAIESKLGSGAFGVVYKARWHATACVVKENLIDDEERQREFLKEASAMTRMHPHPNIVQLLGVCVDPQYPMAIVLEWVDAGSLDAYLHDKERDLPAKVALELCRDIAAGMQHLHAEGILHCDLSARNVLLAYRRHTYIAKIADFGLSHFTNLGALGTYSAESAMKLPIRWTSPEILENPNQSTKAGDVWSFGVVLWEVFQRELPYQNMPENSQVIVAVSKGYRLPLPTKVSHPDEIDEIITCCFSTDPADRPTMEHIYFKIEKLFLPEDAGPESKPVPVEIGRYKIPMSTSISSEDTSSNYKLDGNLSGGSTPARETDPYHAAGMLSLRTSAPDHQATMVRSGSDHHYTGMSSDAHTDAPAGSASDALPAAAELPPDGPVDAYKPDAELSPASRPAVTALRTAVAEPIYGRPATPVSLRLSNLGGVPRIQSGDSSSSSSAPASPSTLGSSTASDEAPDEDSKDTTSVS